MGNDTININSNGGDIVISDYSEGLTKAGGEIFPAAGFQADHFHTVKAVRKNLKKGCRNTEGIVKRKSYIKIYQTIKYLPVDITDFLNHKTESGKPPPG